MVYRAVGKSRLINDVYVATDDARIEAAVRQYGGKVILTGKDHPTGSDRVAEAAGQLPDADIIINIQGDEPFISDGIIDPVIRALDDPDVVMSTACAPFADPADAANPDNVKVVLGKGGDALYFSRSRIPFCRSDDYKSTGLYKHIGIYGFKRDFLMIYAGLERTPLEQAESLEQLRALEHGYRIRTVIVEWDFPGIDSKEDLIKAEVFLGETEKSNG